MADGPSLAREAVAAAVAMDEGFDDPSAQAEDAAARLGRFLRGARYRVAMEALIKATDGEAALRSVAADVEAGLTGTARLRALMDEYAACPGRQDEDGVAGR